MRSVMLSRLCVCLVLLAVVVNGRPSFQSDDVDDQSSVSNDDAGLNSVSNDITADNSGIGDDGVGGGSENAIANDTQIPSTATVNTAYADGTAAGGQSSDGNATVTNNSTTTTTTSSNAGTETSDTNEQGQQADGTSDDSLADYLIGLLKGKPQPSEIASVDQQPKTEGSPPFTDNTTGPESAPPAAEQNSDGSSSDGATAPQSTSAQSATLADGVTVPESASSQGATLSDNVTVPESTSSQSATVADDFTVPESTSSQSATMADDGTVPAENDVFSASTTLPESITAQNTMPVTDQAEAGDTNTASAVTDDTDTSAEDDYYHDWADPWEFDDNQNPDTDPCSIPVNLDNYCLVDDSVSSWFGEDLTIHGLQDSLFDMAVVEELAGSCPRGNWCLDYDVQFRPLRRRLSVLAVMCLDSMMECLLDVVAKRESCTDKDTAEFRFIVDSAVLVCNVTASTPPRHYDSCLLDGMEALYVMYSDFKATNMTFPQPEIDVACGGPALKLTDTFLCNGDCQHDVPKQLLRTFIGEKYNQPGCSNICNQDEAQTAQSLTTPSLTPASGGYNAYDDDDDDHEYDGDNNDDDDNYNDNDEYYGDKDESDDGDNYSDDDEYNYYNDEDDDDDQHHDDDNDNGGDESSTSEDDWFDFTTMATTTGAGAGDGVGMVATTSYYDYFPYTTTSYFYPESNLNGDYDHDSQEGQDESLMLALVVASTVGIMFMVLGLVYWKRNRRRHLYYSHGDGYSRLPEDVGPLLGGKSFN